MTEFLPETIKSHLRQVSIQLGLDPATVKIAISKESASAIGSSCCVTLSSSEDGESGAIISRRIFVKFYQNGETNYGGEFGEEAEAYFGNETLFYGEISKRFGELAGGGGLTCVPKCFCVGDEPQFIGQCRLKFIMLEDLTENWTAFDGNQVSRRPISVENARVILQQLGHFHAHSLALQDQRPDQFAQATSKIRETLFVQGCNHRRRLLVHAVHDALKLLQKSLLKDSQYTSKFADFTLNLTEIVEDLLNDREFQVITHGDLFPSNILWNEGDNSAIFVDFSGCRLASPVHDLMLFILISLDRRRIQDHWDDLLRCYHISLCRKVEALGSDPLRVFPRSALDAQLSKHTKFAMVLALVGLPLYLHEDSRISSGEEKTHENVLGLVQEVRRQMSVKCKSKMLEIIMEVSDRDYLLS